MPRVIENKLFYESSKWQRFVHFLYINDVEKHLFTNNCDEIISKALRYAYLSKQIVKTNVASVISFLQKSDYLDYFKSNINKLKSLQDQNSLSVESTLAEFHAPVLHSRLMLWYPIFQKWKQIYNNPKSDVYNVVYNGIDIILNGEKKTVPTFALNLGLKNPNNEIYKKLANSLQCKQSHIIRNLLKQTVFEEVPITNPYERGNGKFLFLTDKAYQYSDNWDISYLSSSNVRISLLQNTQHADHEFSVKNEDSVGTSFKNIWWLCLSSDSSKKRKMSDLSLNDDDIDNRSHKKRKLHCSTEPLNETNDNQEKDSFDLSGVISSSDIYKEEQSDINNTSEIRHVYEELKIAKTIIKDLSEEKKNMLVQIKDIENQRNQESEQLNLQIIKLEEELQEHETLKVYQELKLREKIESVQKELEEIRERVKKEHQEKTQKSEEISYVCSIA